VASSSSRPCQRIADRGIREPLRLQLGKQRQVVERDERRGIAHLAQSDLGCE
jgi:hypothetical protein